jgi:hypothetical protein
MNTLGEIPSRREKAEVKDPKLAKPTARVGISGLLFSLRRANPKSLASRGVSAITGAVGGAEDFGEQTAPHRRSRAIWFCPKAR